MLRTRSQDRFFGVSAHWTSAWTVQLDGTGPGRRRVSRAPVSRCATRGVRNRPPSSHGDLPATLMGRRQNRTRGDVSVLPPRNGRRFREDAPDGSEVLGKKRDVEGDRFRRRQHRGSILPVWCRTPVSGIGPRADAWTPLAAASGPYPMPEQHSGGPSRGNGTRGRNRLGSCHRAARRRLGRRGNGD